jgi:hypothetical protein
VTENLVPLQSQKHDDVLSQTEHTDGKDFTRSDLSGTAPAQSAGYTVLPSDGEFDPQQPTVLVGSHLSVELSVEPGPAGTPHVDWL